MGFYWWEDIRRDEMRNLWSLACSVTPEKIRVQRILKRIISLSTEDSIYSCGILTLRENEPGLWLRQRAPGNNSRNEARP